MKNLFANPTAFTLFGKFPVYWYGIIITGAILAGTTYVLFECKRRKKNYEYMLTLFLWTVPFAVLFARLAYVLFHVSDFFPLESFADFGEIFNVRAGGISILGAVPGGILGAFINAKIHKEINFSEVLDMLAPGMILGQALGRWGNFVNQELYGAEITNEAWQHFPIAVQIDTHYVYDENGILTDILKDHWFQATFFYEMVLNLIGFAIIVVIGHKTKKNLVCLFAYIAWYCAVRAVMESIRTDAVVVGGVHIGVVGCAIASALAVLMIVLIEIGVIKTKSPDYLKQPILEPDDE